MSDLRVTYDLIAAMGKTSLAADFDVASWTNLAYVPGRTAYTTHQQQVVKGAKIKSAYVRFVMDGATARARLAAFRYDENNQPVNVLGWPEMAVRAGLTVDNQAFDITALLNSAIEPGYIYLHPEVTGKGTLYMVRLELFYDVPAPADLTVLGDRITALEAGAVPADITELTDRVAALEAEPAVDLSPLETRVAELEAVPPLDLSPLESRLATLEAQLSAGFVLSIAPRQVA